jgi:hypothetical protein
MEPNILAHSSLATTDIGATCFFVGTLYFLWRTCRIITPLNLAGLSTLVYKFANVLFRSSSDWFGAVGLGLSFRKKIVEVLFYELPFEWSSDPFVMLLASKETLLEHIEGREVIRREGLSFQNGKVDFDLVKPAGGYGTVNQDEMGVFFLEAQDTLEATM